MFNLFDIMQNEGGGIYGLGQQYGLSPDQSRRAIEALLPALTIGLQRNAVNDPAGLGRLFGLFGTEGRQGGVAQSPAPTDLLGQLFGSPALSQAVLQQAASASGIGTQALRPMLPIMAGMVVAGIVHVMLNQPPPAQAAQRQPEPPPRSGFTDAGFWNDWMTTFLPTADATPTPRPEPRAAPPDTRASRSIPALDENGADAGTHSADKAPTGASAELLQQMFQSGIQAQEQNVKAMQGLFDSFWSAPNDAAPQTLSDTSAVGTPSTTAQPSQKGSRKPTDVP